MGYIQDYLAQCPEELLYQDYLEDISNRIRIQNIRNTLKSALKRQGYINAAGNCTKTI